MFTLIVIAILAVFLFFYVAIPLIFPKQADPLPEEVDPIAAELEEEREALFRAILELEERKDLPIERRDALRARYESKAAQALRALDERQTKLKGLKVPAAKKQRTFPYAALALLSLVLVSAVVMGGYVLPRVGSGASVTTAFAEQLEAGRRLRKLQQAASKNPNLENQLALAEAQWEIGFRFEDDEQVIAAINAYENLAREYSELLPATAYFRLGLSQLQNDPDRALANFDKAHELNPNDPEMLVDLAEVYFSFGILEGAIELWQSYLATPEGADDNDTRERLAAVKSLASQYQAVREDPSETNLMALADTLWSQEQPQLAQSAYLTVIKDHNSGNTLALSRAGQAMFMGGDNKEAVVILSRARDLEREQGKQDLSTLLFLGNAYFSLKNYAEAITIWEEYVELAGDEDSAGRVPSLIVQARARLAGSEEGVEEFASEGQRLYQANCTACHGARGEGSSAISLRNQKLTEARVARIVRDGKGLMPAFEVLLSSEEIAAIAKFVAEEIALR